MGRKQVSYSFVRTAFLGEKKKQVRFSSSIHKSKGPLVYLHSELWGLAKVYSMGGTTYMLTIIDDFSCKVWVFFLKQKKVMCFQYSRIGRQ